MSEDTVTEEEVEAAYKKIKQQTESVGYYLNPDEPFTKQIIRGLLTNQKRMGYQACPCRFATGNRAEDLDIICPCDYRDPDLEQYETCYSGYYVSRVVARGEKKIESIPERRLPAEERMKMAAQNPSNQSVSKPAGQGGFALGYPIWRCKVCGYICARNEPPEICPICKVTKDRFERFI